MYMFYVCFGRLCSVDEITRCVQLTDVDNSDFMIITRTHLREMALAR
jgi:hypothetical protein